MKKNYSLFFILFFSFSLSAQNPALNFDGTNDYIQTLYPGVSGTNNRTIEAWIKTTSNSIPNAGGIQHVITDWGSFVTGGRFTFCVLWGNAIRLEVGGNGLSGTIAVNDGLWHHVAVTYNSSLTTNQYSLYVDGVLDVSGNLTVATNTISSINMRIGQRVDGVNPFEGEIDEVRVYDFAKTQAEIIADKDKELCAVPAGLVSYYRLNEGIPNGVNSSNNIALDYSGGGNTGTLTGFSLVGSSSNWSIGPVLNPANSYATFNATACNSYTSPSGVFTWTSSGVYNDVIPNSVGCDSVMTINLSIGNVNSSINPSVCSSYTSPNGNVYTTSTNFIDTLVGASSVGCDSIINISLTVGSSGSSLDTVSCGSYTSPSGNIYTSSSIFNDTLVGASSLGCDSIINIDLTVAFPSMTNASMVSCEDSILINGNWYFTNQNVVINEINSLGCDSIHTIVLSFSSPTFEALNISSCGTYTSPLGQSFNSNSIFAETYMTSEGCDSIIEYTLTINNGSSTDNSISACDSAELNGTWYYNTQTVTNFYSDDNGCDSTVITNIDISSISGNVISAIGETLSTIEIVGANYEWLNCETNQVINGANTFEYESFETGFYSVIITNGSCSSRSECYNIVFFGIEDLYNQESISVNPNPNNGNFKVWIIDDNELESYEIINVIGKTVHSNALNSNTFYINKDMSNGLYFLKVKSRNTSYLKQFMVR